MSICNVFCDYFLSMEVVNFMENKEVITLGQTCKLLFNYCKHLKIYNLNKSTSKDLYGSEGGNYTC